jgi:uncharacterized protein (TIGR03437 family)
MSERMTFGPDHNLYLAGVPGNSFHATPGTLQTSAVGPPGLPAQGLSCCATAIVKADAQLGILAATYFGDLSSTQIRALALDASGNIYAGGAFASRALPTRTPLFEDFGPAAGTGFLSELSNDLSTLLFSTFLGDNEYFAVQSAAIASGGSVVIGGSAGNPNVDGPTNVYINSLAVAAPQALRIDSVLNAASQLGGSVSPGETILIRGAGFGGDSRVTIGDTPLSLISIAATEIAAVVPANIAMENALAKVQSGGRESNQVLIPVAAVSPGLFSADGSGYGQGYILNQDGALNTPAHPAAPGEKITIYATGVGKLSFDNGYAVTASPPNVFIDGAYANGVAAVSGSIAGFPGDVYRLTIFVPDSPFTFPPQVGVILQIAGASSQRGLAISIAAVK